MPTQWSALVWKEWHEHKWKLASLVAIVICVLGFSWQGYRGKGSFQAGDFFVPLIMVLMFFVPLASAFLAMSAAANERARGTLPLLQSLPIRPQRIAALKLAFALATVLVPLWVAIGVSFVAEQIARSFGWQGINRAVNNLGRIAEAFGTGVWAIDLGIAVSLVAASLVIWLSALGVNSASEVRAGAIGLTVVVGLWTVVVTAMNWMYVTPDEVKIVQPLFAALPGGLFLAASASPETEINRPGIVVAYLVVHALLVCWFITRFGRTEGAARWSPQPAAKTPSRTGWLTHPRWLAPPRRTPLGAIIWKQLRESGPIVLVGFACATGLLVASLAGELWSVNARVQTLSDRSSWRLIGEWVSVLFTGFGFLSGLIAGVGVGVTDFDERHVNFWRSRPIDPNLWFVAKFLTGLSLLLVAFGLPLLLGFAAVASWGFYDTHAHQLWIAVYSLVIAYTGAVFAGTVLRQPIYAAILGIGFAASVHLLAYEKIDSHTAANLLLVVSVVGTTVAAWAAVRFDWALRR